MLNWLGQAGYYELVRPSWLGRVGGPSCVESVGPSWLGRVD